MDSRHRVAGPALMLALTGTLGSLGVAMGATAAFADPSPPPPAPVLSLPPVSLPGVKLPPVNLPVTVPPLVGDLLGPHPPASTPPPSVPVPAPTPPAPVPAPPATPASLPTPVPVAAPAAPPRPAAPSLGAPPARLAVVDAVPASPAGLGGNAVQAARTLSFPLGIAGLVVVFLAVQSRIDSGDPRLALAPLDAEDDALGFS